MVQSIFPQGVFSIGECSSRAIPTLASQAWASCDSGIRQDASCSISGPGSGPERPRLSSQGFRAEASALHSSGSSPGPQPGSSKFPQERGVGPGWAGAWRAGLQKVALWSFEAAASARACSPSSDPHGMAAVGARWGFRREGVGW